MSSFRFLSLSRSASIVTMGAVAALVCLVVGGPAWAKGPEAGEMPSVEEIVQADADSKAADAEAARIAALDPRREAIAAYRDGKTPLEAFAPLVEILNNSKDDDVQVYRNQASQAILLRFKAEKLDDPQVRRTRATLALGIIDLMKANSSDQVGLAIIQEVLQTWWATKTRSELRFKATDKWRERAKAWRKMKSYLSNGER